MHNKIPKQGKGKQCETDTLSWCFSYMSNYKTSSFKYTHDYILLFQRDYLCLQKLPYTRIHIIYYSQLRIWNTTPTWVLCDMRDITLSRHIHQIFRQPYITELQRVLCYFENLAIWKVPGGMLYVQVSHDVVNLNWVHVWRQRLSSFLNSKHNARSFCLIPYYLQVLEYIVNNTTEPF